MTIEAPCGVVEGISNMLLQSWNGIIRLFPAIPSHWRDISFSNLLTEGAFEVSAKMENSLITCVSVRGISSTVCRLKNPFSTNEFQSENCLVNIKDNIIEITISDICQEAILLNNR
jgi:alpha-L-fucosidase 2